MALAAAGAGRAADLRSLVRAELAFSRLSEAQGIRPSFLACFAEDSIIFRPRPVPGRKYYQDRASIPGRLSWKPVFADIAGSGDLGYTTGPYEFRKEKASDPVAGRGHFVSVWRVQEDGTWKVVFDGGIDYPDAFTSEPALDPDRLPARPASAASATTGSAKSTASPPDSEKTKAELLDLERAVSDAAAGTGTRALADVLSADVRINYSGAQPVRGKAACLAALSKMPGTSRFSPESVFVSNAGDLGYVIGISEYAAGATAGSARETNSYIHIWKKSSSGRWEIVLQVTVPVPPSPPGG